MQYAKDVCTPGLMNGVTPPNIETNEHESTTRVMLLELKMHKYLYHDLTTCAREASGPQ